MQNGRVPWRLCTFALATLRTNGLLELIVLQHFGVHYAQDANAMPFEDDVGGTQLSEHGRICVCGCVRSG